MFTQERANFVMWSQRTHAETTDEITVPHQFRETQEEAEEETPTDDEVATVAESPGSATTLLENLRLDQNIALAGERWTEASELPKSYHVSFGVYHRCRAGRNVEGQPDTGYRLFRVKSAGRYDHSQCVPAFIPVAQESRFR